MTPSASATAKGLRSGHGQGTGAKRSIGIPPHSLVLLIGPAGSGKSTFARRHFSPTEILSSDYFRALVADDEDNQRASGDAFEVLHFIAEKRLRHGRLTVVDATNVLRRARRPLLEMARTYGRPAVAVVFDLPEEVCLEWNERRPGRRVPPEAIRRQREQLHRSLVGLRREGFQHIYRLRSPEVVEAARVARGPD